MDKDKRFQDLLQDSLKELQGEQHEQSNTATPLFTFTDTIRAGIEEYNRHNRSKREQSRSLSYDRQDNTTSYHGSTLEILNQRKGRGRAESERSQAMGEGTRSINTRSVSLKESNQEIQEIYSAQNRLSQTERREFSEILRETELFKQQATQTYTDIQNITHTLDTTDSKNNIETYQALESPTNTNESHNETKENKEHNESLQSQLKILKEHTHILTTTLSPRQKEQSYNKITKALENIENLTKNSNIDSTTLENNTKLIQRATELINKHEKDKLRDNNKNKGRDR